VVGGRQLTSAANAPSGGACNNVWTLVGETVDTNWSQDNRMVWLTRLDQWSATHGSGWQTKRENAMPGELGQTVGGCGIPESIKGREGPQGVQERNLEV